MQYYDSVKEALADLQARGFTIDFNIAFDQLTCKLTGICLKPEDFEIVEHHRFEADTNPDESSVVYAIASIDGTQKGILVDAYGIYGEPRSDEMIRKLKVHHD